MPQQPRNRDSAFLRGGDRQPRSLTITPATVKAAAGGDPPTAVSGRRFAFLAYTGTAMIPMGWYDQVVIDLAGVDVPSQTMPALVEHMPYTDCVIGQTDAVRVDTTGIAAEGDVMAVGEEALEALRLADLGYQFQASVGAKIVSREFVDAGAETQVNGRTMPGPLVVVRKCVLREVSLTVCGADAGTSFTLDEETPEPKPAAKPEPKPETTANARSGAADRITTLAASGRRNPPTPESTVATPTNPNIQDLIRAALAAEHQRAADINRLTERHPELRAKAFGEGWPTDRVELEVLRAERTTVQASSPLGKPGSRMSPQILTCAMSLRAGVQPKVLEPEYGQDVIHAATSGESRRHASLSYLLNATLMAAGRPVFFGAPGNEDILAAFQADRDLRASGGVSGYSISGILSNVANKTLLQSYQMVDRNALKVFKEADANDFKQVSRYGLTADGDFKKVAPDGKLTHGTMTEEKYTNQLDTYGRHVGVSRQDWINDDLGAFTTMSQKFGRAAIITLKKLAFGKVITPRANFYSAGNKNLSTGGGSALAVAGLTAAVKLFREQTDVKGEQISVVPKFLLVPPSLEMVAKQLYVSTNLQELTASPKPMFNPHANSYEPLCDSYLGTAGGLGGNDTQWWLFGDPMDVASFEILYLRGQRNPTVETSDLDFDSLGAAFRAYFDIGVNDQDHRGSNKSNGA